MPLLSPVGSVNAGIGPMLNGSNGIQLFFPSLWLYSCFAFITKLGVHLHHCHSSSYSDSCWCSCCWGNFELLCLSGVPQGCFSELLIFSLSLFPVGLFIPLTSFHPLLAGLIFLFPDIWEPSLRGGALTVLSFSRTFLFCWLWVMLFLVAYLFVSSFFLNSICFLVCFAFHSLSRICPELVIRTPVPHVHYFSMCECCPCSPLRMLQILMLSLILFF